MGTRGFSTPFQLGHEARSSASSPDPVGRSRDIWLDSPGDEARRGCFVWWSNVINDSVGDKPLIKPPQNHYKWVITCDNYHPYLVGEKYRVSHIRGPLGGWNGQIFRINIIPGAPLAMSDCSFIYIFQRLGFWSSFHVVMALWFLSVSLGSRRRQRAAYNCIYTNVCVCVWYDMYYNIL